MEAHKPKMFRVTYTLDDVEVLTIEARATNALKETLEHVTGERVFETLADVFHIEADNIAKRATFVKWFGKTERKEPRERTDTGQRATPSA